MIVAGTGHRPNKLGGYSEEATERLVNLAMRNLGGATRVISGMALGWDTALALAALELEIPLTAAVPFHGQERMWPKSSQDRFHKILDQADDIVYVCDKGYAAWKMQVRNEYMVDKCDVLLALWDGSEGGTGNCIKYAKKVHRDINNIWEQYEKE